MRAHPVIHVSQLTRYNDPEEFPDRPPPIIPPEPEMIEGQQEWVVEKVLGKRTNKQGGEEKVQYLVKWRNYPNDDNTWEPSEILKMPQD